MKKMKLYVSAILAAVCLTACYDDYVKDYEVQSVYFAFQTDVRSVIVGEGMKFSTGIMLAGVIENSMDRRVKFTVDNSLLNDDAVSALKNHDFTYIKDHFATIDQIEALPSDVYKLLVENQESNEAIIRKGQHLGSITVQVDSAKFLSDASRLVPDQAIAFRITESDSAPALEGKESEVICVRYENMLFGHWWHGGVTVVTDATGQEVDRIEYFTTIPQADSKVWTLTTVAPDELTTNAMGGNQNSSKSELKLKIDMEDGSIDVSSADGASYDVTSDGVCQYNRAKLLQNRQIFLKYKWEADGKTYHATDTLTFRNRIRDGVNEVRDENPNNYQ